MISNDTVLILGAGASYPYGFPLGKELIKHIWQIGNSPELPAVEQIIRINNSHLNLDITGEDVRSFVLSLNASHLNSIDAFLEGKDIKKLAIGKLLIVQSLLGFENSEKVLLRDFELNQKLDKSEVERYSRRWYDYLFNKMYCPWELFHKNKITIITFNYDRSLEYFLFNTMKNAYPGRSEEDYNTKFSQMPIIHLHGRMGNLPHEGGIYHGYANTTHYLDPIFDKTMLLLSQQIRVIHEEVEASEEFVKANEIIRTSRYASFLGFGFHELNIKRLSRGIRGRNSSNGDISGSAFQIEKAEKEDISRQFYSLTNTNITLGQGAHDVLSYLRNNVNFFV